MAAHAPMLALHIDSVKAAHLFTILQAYSRGRTGMHAIACVLHLAGRFMLKGTLRRGSALWRARTFSQQGDAAAMRNCCVRKEFQTHPHEQQVGT
eukprot:6180418-Pleurochrysis_carterae.AAC.4